MHRAVQCEQCGRTFSRREHLVRHTRIHTKEKPYTCTVCSKSYARQDVYVRHLQTHGSGLANEAMKRQNIRAACDECHRRKVKCHHRTSSGGQASQVVSEISVSQPEEHGIGSPQPLLSEETQEQCTTEPNREPAMPHEHTAGSIPSSTNSSNDPGQSGVTFDWTTNWSSGRLDLQPLTYGSLLSSQPFLGVFEDNSQGSWNPTMETYFGDFSITHGYSTLDQEFASWMNAFGPQDLAIEHNDPQVGWQTAIAEPDNHNHSSVHHAEAQNESTIAAALTRLHEYTAMHQSARPRSPQSAKAHEQYLRDLGGTAPVTCDPLIINIFVTLFQTRLAPYFAFSKTLSMDVYKPDELCLAMAATGGLYCETPRSDIVAKWLLHMARRKLLTLAHHGSDSTPAQRLKIMQTYVLMETFAYLCGDKRIFLLLEVFHGQVIEAFYALDSPDVDWNTENEEAIRSVRYAVAYLESYRVVLLQRPAMLYPTTSLGDVINVFQHNEKEFTQADDKMNMLVRALTSFEIHNIGITSKQQSLQTLFTLSLLTSHARRLPGSLSRLLDLADARASSRGQDRQQEFLELALSKWIATHVESPTTEALVLFHLIHLCMYCNFAEVERAARTAMEGANQEPAQRTGGGISLSNVHSLSPTHHIAIQEQNGEKTHWHASRLLEIASEVRAIAKGSTESRNHLEKDAKALTSEGPIHLNYAIYYASLTLWLMQKDGTSYEDSFANCYSCTQVLTRGSLLLSSSSARVAAGFKHVLDQLQMLPG